jgi:hypothetical protein
MGAIEQVTHKVAKPLEDVVHHVPAPKEAFETGQADWDAAREKALVRKLDIRIFPAMIVLFILNFLDRNNFANARLQVGLCMKCIWYKS